MTSKELVAIERLGRLFLDTTIRLMERDFTPTELGRLWQLTGSWPTDTTNRQRIEALNTL